MNHALHIVFALVAFTGCAGTQRSHAIRVGHIAKEVVDAGAVAVKAHIDARASACAPRVDDGTKALTDCLGPIASHPDEVDGAFAAARAAQLGVYLAVSTDASPAEIKQARNDLEAALRAVVALIQSVAAQEAE
ncbi:MAG: hypothetical protein COA94_06005 [Rickettsiales bacterium]|nr:MAG: hypothetical protein COA94_06005 [Rickettsiales bacterium]